MSNGTKLDCETNELSATDENYIPEGAFCRMTKGTLETAIKCKKGQWKKINRRRKKHRRNHKRKASEGSACQPSPCLNGATCLISQFHLHQTYICLCPPTYEGM